jgi:hypothetical protein
MRPAPKVQVLFLKTRLPDRTELNTGVLLLDPATGKLYFRMREDWDDMRNSEYPRVMAALGDKFMGWFADLGSRSGTEFLQSIENQLSSLLILSDRRTITLTANIRSTLDTLFEANCRS